LVGIEPETPPPLGPPPLRRVLFCDMGVRFEPVPD
jgi:hypothetical protein